jgi:hypothetical protein
MPAARLNKSSQLISIQTRRPSDESLARPKIPHRSCVEATMPPKRSAEKGKGRWWRPRHDAGPRLSRGDFRTFTLHASWNPESAVTQPAADCRGGGLQ